MKTKILISILFLVLQSCKKEIEKPLQKDVQVKKTDIKPNISKVIDSIKTITHKGYLGDVAHKYYGNKAYYLPLTKYNKLKDGYYLKKKTQIHIPSFSQMVKDTRLGIDSSVHKEIDLILQARELYLKHERELRDLRKGREPVILPKNIKKDLEKATNLIDEAILLLKKTNKPPKKMIGQLNSVALNLKRLSKGSNDGYGYDLDMVHQRLAHAFKNGMVWSRKK